MRAMLFHFSCLFEAKRTPSLFLSQRLSPNQPFSVLSLMHIAKAFSRPSSIYSQHTAMRPCQQEEKYEKTKRVIGIILSDLSKMEEFEMVHEIRHCFYHSDHDATLRSFDLPKEQQRFTALPAEALKACSEEKERKPIVILHQERPVGFFVLHTGKRLNKSIPLRFAERNASLPMKGKKSSLFSSIDVRLISE
ncbi:hypothetical protein [Geobacillus zalihae]|uniref:hypothetical protein n=1 Tax=Geobacillus zalihae TaxID=213419 RepID=UPI001CC1F447|nr:hypothetical protein [Geobacillus zalihae]